MVGILVVSFFTTTIPSRSDKIKGFFFEEEGFMTFMIIYEPGQDGSLDIQTALGIDEATLRSDTFRLFISGGTNEPKNITVSMYEATGFHNASRTLKYALEPVARQKGVNEQGNQYYYDAEFQLRLSNQTEIVEVEYANRTFWFEHRTVEFLLPQTLTTGAILSQLLIVFVIGIVVAIVAFFASIGLWLKYGYVPFLPFSAIALLIIFSLASFLGFLIFDLSLDFDVVAFAILRNLAFFIVIPLFIILTFGFGNVISLKSGMIKNKLIFALKLDDKTKEIRKLLKKDKVLEINDNLYHVHAKNDWQALKEFVLALFGYRERYYGWESIDIPDMAGYKSDFELILSSDYQKHTGEFLPLKKVGWKLYLFPLFGLIGLTLTVILDINLILDDIRTFFYAIFSFVFLAGIVLAINDAKTQTSSPFIKLDPIVDEEILELLLKIDVVKRLKKEKRELRSSLMVSGLTGSLEELADIQAIISGDDPEDILAWLVDLEDQKDQYSVSLEEIDQAVLDKKKERTPAPDKTIG